MGLRKVLHALDGPTVLCYCMHVASATAVPVMTKLLITQIRFPYTATLALTQAVIIAICLWFWTIFGVFKVRVLAMRTVVPLAVTAALSNVLQLLTLAHASLLHYQIARLLPLAATTSPAEGVPLVLAAALLLLLHPPPLHGLFLLSACVAAALLDRSPYVCALRKRTRASELQFQLPLRSMMAVLIAPAVPLVDDYSSQSAGSILLFPFDESVTILIFSTGVAAFFAFVAVRASAARLSGTGFRGAALSAALAVFVMHFVMRAQTVSLFDAAAVALVLGGALHASLAAERRRRAAARATAGLLPTHGRTEPVAGGAGGASSGGAATDATGRETDQGGGQESSSARSMVTSWS